MSYDVERGFISKLLQTKDISTIKDSQIRPDFFSGESRTVYQFIQDTILETGEVPSVRALKRKFPTYSLETVKNDDGEEVVGTEENLKYWCNELRLKKKHNTLADTIDSVAEKLQDFDTEEAYNILKKNIAYIESEVVETADVDLTKNTEDRKLAYLEKKQNKGMRGIPTGFKHLDFVLKGLEKETLTTLIARTGIGKRLDLNTPILTPEGFIPLRDIHAGSTVFDENGVPCKVLLETPVVNTQVYRVRFEDGTFVDCCADHLWKFKTVDDLSRHNDWRVKTTKELVEKYPIRRGRSYNLCIPVNKAIQFERKDLPIDPYALGALLGDGGFTTDSITFTNPEKDIVDRLNERISDLGKFVPRKGDDTQYSFKSDVYEGRKYKLNKILYDLNLRNKYSCGKFIPEIYLRASVSQRMDLLRGLIDTDGHVDSKGHIHFSTSSPVLADDFVKLVRSLGYRCVKHTYFREEKGVDYSCSIRSDEPLFYSKKHWERYKNRHIPRRHNYYDILKITGIEVLDKFAEMKCLSVDSPEHTFICGDYIVTHNTWFEIFLGANCQLNNYRVLQLVTEMSEDIMRDRYEAVLFSMCYGDFNYGQFKSGALSPEIEKKYFKFLEEDLPRFEPLIIATATGVMGVSAAIDKYKPDIVLIDSAYLMEDDQGAKDDWLRVTHITRDLKKLAKRAKIPIFINTQADKSTSRKTGPEIENISYAQSIGMDSLPINTSVLTEQGYRLIQNLEGEVFKIYDGFKLKKAYCTKTTENKQVVEIHYYGDKVFRCSPNHKCYVFDNQVGNYVWKRAKDIEPNNDFIVKLKDSSLKIGGFNHILRVVSDRGNKPIHIPIDATEELGRFIGYMIGDGSVRGNKNEATLSCGYDEEYAQEAIRIVEKYFGLTGKIIKAKTKLSKGEQLNVHWYSAKFHDWCEYFIEREGKKTILPSFIEMNDNFRRGLIAGLFQSDGNFHKIFSFGTVHRELANELCELLDTFNVGTVIHTSYSKWGPCYNVRVKRRDESFFNTLIFVGERESFYDVPRTNNYNNRVVQPSTYVVELANSIINCSDRGCNDPLAKRAYEARRKRSTSPDTLRQFEKELGLDNPYTFFPVTDVVITDEFVPMWDVQVFDTDKRVITGGVVTHNSDNILALFRDEVMTNDKEMGLKILKQREGTLGTMTLNWDFTTMNFSEIYLEEDKDEEIKDNTLGIMED